MNKHKTARKLCFPSSLSFSLSFLRLSLSLVLSSVGSSVTLSLVLSFVGGYACEITSTSSIAKSVCRSWGVISLTIAYFWKLYTLWILVQLHEAVPGKRYNRYMELAQAAFDVDLLGKALAAPSSYAPTTKMLSLTDKVRLDAVRTESIFLDGNGHAFWRLEGYSDEPHILLQDIGSWDSVTPYDKWFTYSFEQCKAVADYISCKRLLQGTPVNIIVGSYVWVEDQALAWINGEVSKINGAEAEIRTRNGKTVIANLSRIYPKDKEAVTGGVDDMTKLSYLHEPGVL